MYLEPIFFPSFHPLWCFVGSVIRILQLHIHLRHQISIRMSLVSFLDQYTIQLSSTTYYCVLYTYKRRKKGEKYVTFNSFSKPYNLLAQSLFFYIFFNLSRSQFLSLFLSPSFSPLIFHLSPFIFLYSSLFRPLYSIVII